MANDFWYFSRISKHDSLSWKFYSYGTGCYYGLVQGPTMLIKVLTHFVIEQTIEGRFVSSTCSGK